MTSPKRIIDANGNRAREALRVLEEAARFLIENPALARELKQMRHDLCLSLAAIPGLIHHRDTPGDVGTTITTPSEQTRQSTADVVHAAASRLSEALRTIEEYAKLLTSQTTTTDLAATAERLRYRGYDLAQQLTRALGSGRGRQWRLCLLLTEALCTHHDWRGVLDHAVCNGVDAVQVREKHLDGGPLLERVREVIALVDNRASVIVNDRPDVALLSGADGVHLGQTDLNPAEVRKLAGNDLIIGVSTSELDQAKRARDDGADYCGVGPMFATTTKHKSQLAGPAYLCEYLSWNGLPHLAIGGVNPDNVDQLAAVGCRGVAASASICSAEGPAEATRVISETLRHAQSGVNSQSGTNPSD